MTWTRATDNHNKMEVFLRHSAAYERRRSRTLPQLERPRRQGTGNDYDAIDVQVTSYPDHFAKQSQ
jgi:hypothetical protein